MENKEVQRVVNLVAAQVLADLETEDWFEWVCNLVEKEGLTKPIPADLPEDEEQKAIDERAELAFQVLDGVSVLAKSLEKKGTKIKWYKADLVSIDAWKEEGCWTWNASYIVERDIVFGEDAITPRRVLSLLRKMGQLSEWSKGRVKVADEWPIIEVQLKSNGRPLYALMFNETPCGHK